MKNNVPLSVGDEIRVIAPSQSIPSSKRKRARYAQSEERLVALGYKVSYGQNIEHVVHLGTASTQERADDFNAAYADQNVKAVYALGGGWSANEILPFIDWDIVASNPKPLIGFSDITVLHNAIYAYTGVHSLLGPTFGTIGSNKSWEYSLDSLHLSLQHKPQSYERSKKYVAGHPSVVKQSQPWKVLQHGTAEARTMGGNVGTLYLLQGTPYQLAFDTPFILLAEDDAHSGKFTPHEFSRRLESILQQPGARENLKGLLIGRFEPDAKMTLPLLHDIIASKNINSMPVIANIDFGHTYPMVTIPIGGTLKIDTKPNIQIAVTKY